MRGLIEVLKWLEERMKRSELGGGIVRVGGRWWDLLGGIMRRIAAGVVEAEPTIFLVRRAL